MKATPKHQSNNTKKRRGRPRKKSAGFDADATKPVELSALGIRLIEKFEDGELVDEFFKGKGDQPVFRLPQNVYDAAKLFRLVVPKTQVRYVELKGGKVEWYHYDGKVWQTRGNVISGLVDDFMAAVDQIYSMVQKSIFEKVAEIERNVVESTEKEIAFVAWAERVKSFLFKLRHEPNEKYKIIRELGTTAEYRTVENEFDTNPYLLNVDNGSVDLRTGELRPHDPTDVCRKKISIPFVESAKDEKWEMVIRDVTCGDPELSHYLQKIFGYSSTGLNQEKHIFIHFGPKDTGKSLTSKAVQLTLGEEANEPDSRYSSTVSKLLSVSKDGRGGGSIGDYVMASLYGKRFGFSSETGRNDRLNADRVKMLTGGDLVPARNPYGTFFDFEPSIKVHVATNYMPDTDATDSALWDRMVILPYDAKLKKVDKTLGEYFKKNRDARIAILSWIVEGARLYFQEGIDDIPQRCIDAKASYRFESDEILQFIESETLLGPNSEISGTDLYAAYQEFMQVRMRGRVPLGRNKFYLALEERSNSDWRVERGGLKNQLRVSGLSLKRGTDEASTGDRAKETVKRFIEDRCRYDLTVETELTVLHEELGRYCADHTPGSSISKNQLKDLLPKIGYLHEVEITAGRGRSGRPLVQLVRGIGLKVVDGEGQLAA